MGTHADSRSLPRPSAVFSLIVPLSAIAAVGLSGCAGDIAAANNAPVDTSGPADAIATETTVQAPKSAEVHQAETKTAATQALAAQQAADAALRATQEAALVKAESPLTQYVIQPGDTLTHITQTLGWGEVDAVASWNGITDANFIDSGDTLYRPGFTPSTTAAVTAPLENKSTPAPAPVETITVADGVDLGPGSTLPTTTSSRVAALAAEPGAPAGEGWGVTVQAPSTTSTTAPTSPETPVAASSQQAVMDAIMAELTGYRDARGYEAISIKPSLSTVAQAWADSNAAAGKSTPNLLFGKQIEAGFSGAVEMRAVIPAGSDASETAARVMDVFMTNMSTWRYVGTEAFESVGLGITAGADGKLYVVAGFGNYAKTASPVTTTLGLTPAGFIPLPVAQDAPEIWVPRTTTPTTPPTTAPPTTAPPTTPPTTAPPTTAPPTTAPPTVPPTTAPPTTAPPTVPPTTAPPTTAPPTAPPTTAPPTTDSKEVLIANEIHRLINVYRVSKGAKPLVRDSRIDKVAQDWTDHMASTGSLVHNPLYVQQIPAGWKGAAENIAWTSSMRENIAAQLAQQWINSSGHEYNLSNPNSNTTGIGVAFSKDGRVFSTQNFGQYTNLVPPVEPTTPPVTTPPTTAPPTTPPVTTPPTTAPPTTPPVTTPPTTPPTTEPTTPPVTTPPAADVNTPKSILEYINSRRPSNKQLTLTAHSEWYSGHVSASLTGDIKVIGEWMDAEHAAIIEHSRWKKASIVVKDAGSIGGKPVWYVDVFFY